MQSALSSFHEITHTNKLVILGDMLELGTEGPEEHQKILDFLADHHISYLTVGPIFKALNAAGYANVTELKEILRGQQIKDKLILLKGSRGLALEQLLDCL
jgi:UDP-N-acetylmuramoyl-tripeptide--D-alanyl-D-alanine ligase